MHVRHRLAQVRLPRLVEIEAATALAEQRHLGGADPRDHDEVAAQLHAQRRLGSTLAIERRDDGSGHPPPAEGPDDAVTREQPDLPLQEQVGEAGGSLVGGPGVHDRGHLDAALAELRRERVPLAASGDHDGALSRPHPLPQQAAHRR